MLTLSIHLLAWQVGFQIDGNRNRLSNCYIDGGLLNLTEPTGITVTDSLFLNTQAVWNLGATGHAAHVHFRNNMYFVMPGPQKYSETSIQLSGNVSKAGVSDVVVEDEMHLGELGCVRMTTSRQTVEVNNAKSCQFNFTDALVFPWVDEVLYSVSTAGGVVGHVAREIEGDGVLVEVVMDAPVTGTVSMEVRQGFRAYPAQ